MAQRKPVKKKAKAARTRYHDHKRTKRICPVCNKLKDFEARRKTCSDECGHELRRQQELAKQRRRAAKYGIRPSPTATADEIRKMIAVAKKEKQTQQAELQKAKRGALFIANALEEARVSKPPKWTFSKRAKLPRKSNYAVAMLSDTHFDERVYPEQVQGMNAYSREIAELRLRNFFQNTMELANDWLTGLQYDGIVLPLAGDMFTGYIHEELRENAEAPVFDTLYHYGKLLIAGISMLQQQFPRVLVPCVTGNHGRLDRKPRHKHAVHDSYDWALYQFLRYHFEMKNGGGVEFHISDSSDQNFTVYNTRFCLTHGDQFRGGAGISGFYTPLMIGDHRKRRRTAHVRRNYDWLLMGHFHQLIFGTGFIVNGSMVGYNEYSFNRNLDYDPPQQAFFLVDPEHGVTIRAPVHVQSSQERWLARDNVPKF